MITERLALTTVALSATAAGWSAYHVQRARLQHAFHRVGVRAYRASLANGQVHYWAGGRDQGRPLILVHGFGGDALFGWGTQAPLARERFVVMPDLLWFGESHSHAEDFTPAYQAATIMQLLDHLAIAQADVVGISYGGFVVGELARLFPDRVASLTIVDSPGHVYSMDDYHDMLDRLGVDSIADLIVPSDPSGVRRLLQVAYHRPPPVPMFVARDVFAHMFVRWRQEKVRLLDELLSMATDPAVRAYRVTQPSMVVWGEHDTLFPVPIAYRLAQALAAPTEVVVLRGTNHAPNMEAPARFHAALERFLASVAA